MTSLGARNTSFQKKVLGFFRAHGRDLPWRRTSDPYAVLVSEIMLQQTQINRVIPKYREFLAAFPDFQALAAARSRKVLQLWQGLGYNRRALALHRIAKLVLHDHGGVLPRNYEALLGLPGIGRYTAGAICIFAYRQPLAIIETNIRDVYLYHFFPREKEVPDSQILPLIEKTIYRRDPRKWFYALMDYGSHLKQRGVRVNTRSAHYRSHSPFKGSNRQLRGAIVTMLLREGSLSTAQVLSRTEFDASIVRAALRSLAKERVIREKSGRWAI